MIRKSWPLSMSPSRGRTAAKCSGCTGPVMSLANVLGPVMASADRVEPVGCLRPVSCHVRRLAVILLGLRFPESTSRRPTGST